MPYQYIKDTGGWNLSIVDGRWFIEDVDNLRKHVETLLAEPFDLSKDYMLRATLIDLEIDEHVLLVTIHHIASDAWSIPIIIKG